MRALLLAAGLGTRLRPFTDGWPKCLMPIRHKALLDIWLENLDHAGINQVLINLHYHADTVRDFLSRPRWKHITSSYEPVLLGTAGTIRANRTFFSTDAVLVAHADNLCLCDFSGFLRFHSEGRPSDTLITMMTFRTEYPRSCGIVDTDENGVVQAFHEKVANPPGNMANAAIYVLEPEVIDWIEKNPGISDFSTEVIPRFLGRIATWENKDTLSDIGNPQALAMAQKTKIPGEILRDDWQTKFENLSIHAEISALS